MDEEVTLLDLSGESNEPSEVSEVGGVSAVTTSAIGCTAFPADLRGQDGRVVKASFFCEIAMVTRGFETRLQNLSSKEVHIVRRDGFNHVRDSIWRRHQPIF